MIFLDDLKSLILNKKHKKNIIIDNNSWGKSSKEKKLLKDSKHKNWMSKMSDWDSLKLLIRDNLKGKRKCMTNSNRSWKKLKNLKKYTKKSTINNNFVNKNCNNREFNNKEPNNNNKRNSDNKNKNKLTCTLMN